MTDADRDARIVALETMVNELRLELSRVQRPRMSSMRATHTCPACGGRRLLQFRSIKEVTDNGVRELSLQTRFSVWRGAKGSGTIEAFACRTCKLVELHAVSLDDVVPDGKDVVEVNGTDEAPPAAPYR